MVFQNVNAPVVLGLALGLLADPAMATAPQCPIAADLAQGIHLRYLDGTEAEYRQRPDGMIEVTEAGTAAGGGALRFVSRFGLYDFEAALLTEGVVSPDQQVSYSYAGQPPVEPKPKGNAWVGEVTATFPGGATDKETAAYVFGEKGKTDLAGCSYDVIPVSVTFVRAAGWEGQAFLYFPALGLAALVRKSGSGLSETEYPLAQFSLAAQ